MKTIIYYIIVHDIGIINHFEKIGKYSVLKNYKYLLVGLQTEDYSNDKIIQCDRLPHNIEHFNNFLAYTGWWAVGKNSLGKEFDYVVFLEYDTDIVNETEISTMEQNIFDSGWKMMGIAELPTSVCFIPPNDGLCKLVNYTNNGTFWMVTNNIIFEREHLTSFIDDPLLADVFEYLGNTVGCGHMLERYTTLYALAKNIPYGIVGPTCFEHIAMDSHATQGRSHVYENFRNSIR